MSRTLKEEVEGAISSLEEGVDFGICFKAVKPILVVKKSSCCWLIVGLLEVGHWLTFFDVIATSVIRLEQTKYSFFYVLSSTAFLYEKLLHRTKGNERNRTVGSCDAATMLLDKHRTNFLVILNLVDPFEAKFKNIKTTIRNI